MTMMCVVHMEISSKLLSGIVMTGLRSSKDDLSMKVSVFRIVPYYG